MLEEYRNNWKLLLQMLEQSAKCSLVELKIQFEQDFIFLQSNNSIPTPENDDELYETLKTKTKCAVLYKEDFGKSQYTQKFTKLLSCPVLLDSIKMGCISMYYEDDSLIDDHEKQLIQTVQQTINDQIKLQTQKKAQKSTYNADSINLLINSLHGVPWRLNFKTTEFTFIGPQAEKILSYKPEDWPTMAEWGKAIYPDDTAYALNYCTTESLAGNDHIFEYRLIKKDGSIIWIRDVVKVVMDENHTPIELIGFMIDISDLKKTEKELSSVHTQLQRILNSTNTTLNIVDENKNIIFHSSDDVSIIDKKCFEYFCDFDKICDNCPSRSKQFKAKTFTRNLNNASYQVTTYPFIAENGKTHIAEIRVDITERVKKEKQLEELMDKLEFSMNAGNLSYFEYNFNSEMFYCNSVFTKMTGYEFNGKKIDKNWILSRIHPDDIHIITSEINKIKQKCNKHVDLEFRLLTFNNQYVWVKFLGQLTPNNNVNQIGILVDITESKALLDQLVIEKNKSNNANEMKSKFLANMSHEIRTPMNAIMGFSNLLSKHITEPPLNNYLNAIKASGNVLLELINDLLDLAKINSGKLTLKYEDTDISNLISDIKYTFELFAKSKKIELSIVQETQIPNSIVIDSLKIKQILINLVNNAIKFTEDGEVSIHYSFIPEEENQSGILVIKVIDTGIGISLDKQNSIFDPFTQEESINNKVYKGTGLGLSIVHNLLKMMNGSIAIESEVSVGSKFIIRIPKVKYSEGSHFHSLEPNEVNIDKSDTLDKIEVEIKTTKFTEDEEALIIKKFNKSIIPIWLDLNDLISLKKLEEFSKEITDLLSIVNWNELKTYVTKLDNSINAFDFENLPRIISQFEVFQRPFNKTIDFNSNNTNNKS
nr:ATP-binding protein [uncultured Carboxylicivirga sp.]